MVEGNRVLLSASKSISYSIFVQFVFRIATFLINAVIVRYVSKEVIGIVHVRLGLLFTTIYCLTSEPFVRACFSRIDLKDQKNKARTNFRSSLDQTINLLWLCVPIGLLWVAVCSTVWLIYLEWPSSSVTSSYQSAVFCYALAAFIEILSEPIRILTQILLHVKVKPFVEGLSLVVETSVLIACIVYFPSLGLLSFCISKVFYSLSSTLSYYVYICHQIRKNNTNRNSIRDDNDNKDDDDDDDHGCDAAERHNKIRAIKRKTIAADGADDNDVQKKFKTELKSYDFPFTSFRQLLPKKLPTDKKESEEQAAGLLWSFSKQVILKQGFTEGEKYIMTVFGVLSFADQGVYSIVNNLSSMIVRLLFLPMEEGFYLFLSQTLVRTLEAKLQNEESLKLVVKSLEAMLKVRMLLGVTVATFGFTCSFLALDFVFGERLSSPPGPSLLRWNCFYIFLVSINGITEGFHNASTNQKQVEKYNKVMMLFSVAFLMTSWFFTTYLGLGAVGFYLSNCCNMLLRIVYSLVYMRRYFEGTSYIDRPIRSLLPSNPVTLAYLMSFLVTFTSEAYLCHGTPAWNLQRLTGYLTHLLIVCCSLASTLFVIFKSERSLITFLKEQYLSRGKAKTH